MPFMGKAGIYALSVSEENACGGRVVTAPTCGACGVLPGVLTVLSRDEGFSDESVYDGLMIAALIGNIVVDRASISGAEVGCQGEVGVACAMAAAAFCAMNGGSNYQIEEAAEAGLEHHLGLTCDPVMGLVQVPCIERNAVAAGTAINTANLALLGEGSHLISFDCCVDTMMLTGTEMSEKYKETSLGGLATTHC
jgi:L-serine dehydratase